MRYERTDGRNAALGGEHFSIVIAADGRLKGFARIDGALVGGQLPTREETQAIAMDFLRDAAPDLLPVLKTGSNPMTSRCGSPAMGAQKT